MNERVAAAASFLPEPKRRCQQVAEALDNCKIVIWLFPRHISPNRAVSAAVEMSSESLAHKTLSLNQEHGLPGEYIKAGLELTFQHSLDADVKPQQILEHIQNLDLLVIKGIDLLSRKVLELWAVFVNEWARVARARQARGDFPVSLLIPSQNAYLRQLVDEDVNLSLYWYWGWLGELEMQLLAREYVREIGPFGTDSDLLWLESSALGLAGFDAELLFWLLHKGESAGDVEDLVALLKAYGTRRRQWSGENMSTLKGIVNGSGYWQHEGDKPYPSKNLEDLWSNGVLDWQARQGVVVHSSAIALAGDTLELQHRIWREHARVLLPILDRTRLDVCRFLSRSFTEWRGYCESRAEGYLDHGELLDGGWEPVAEFTGILEFLDTTRQNHLSWRRFRDLIYSARHARNRLAHYTPLSKAQFITILEQVKQLQSFIESGL